MASQQYPALDGNNPAMVTNSVRRVARREDRYDEVPRESRNILDSQIRSCAQTAAKSWTLQEPKKPSAAVEKKLERVKDAIERKVLALRGAVPEESALTGDAAIFVQNATLLRQSLQEVQMGLQDGEEIPHIGRQDGGAEARAYAAVASYLEGVGYDFNDLSFEKFFLAVQEAAPLQMAELWQLKTFTQLVLLEAIADLADEVKLETNPKLDAAESGTTSQELTSLQADRPTQLNTLASSLRRIEGIDWKELFERINAAEHILREDPCGVYAQMDFESRDTYRKGISDMAKRSKANEPEIARKALELAGALHTDANERIKLRKSHVGYYLVAEGRPALERAIGYRPTITERVQRFIKRWPDFSYILSIELLTIAIVAGVVYAAKIHLSGLVVIALFLLPAADCAVALINQFATTLFPPKPLPKLDFSEGIPAEFATVAVVPTLLTSEEQMTRAVRDLEIRFLANRDANLHFALLTDPPDAGQQFDEKDKLAERCAKLIRELNEKYARERRGSFFLLHRHRAYNPSEGIWMGWERKRGKLLDFNKLLLGQTDNFPVKAGELSVLRNVKYVITLDLDTQLPRDAAHRLVGAIAHPLNRAVIDPETNTVVDGYGILQPRVDISIQSASRSRLAAIFSGDAGFDIYTRAVSDVYQDLFGEGSFTGKGIYEVEAFQQVLEHRFPCNTILSHDMIEGGYARAGLVSDIEVVDDYPSHVSALSRRKHRWVRGDWQIVFWLLPRVPDFFGKIVPNPLTIISRWKILDNLRRSLTEMATFVMLLCGWLFLPGGPVFWTLVTLGAIALPTYSQFAISILRARDEIFSRMFWKNLAADFWMAQANLLMRLVFLCHQSLVTIDAVVRSIVRMTVTHERLLEWETAAEAEFNNQKKSPVETYLEVTPWLVFFIGLFLAVDRQEAFLVALPLLILWALSKPIGQWLNLPSRSGETNLTADDRELLRRAALRTWRLFREHSTAEENWLVPDTVQEPDSLIVHRISTTNLGLLLNSRLAAVDLGFLTMPEFLADTEKTFDSVDRLPKLHGQLYNWYDNRTLEAVKPRFVSAVDNGNLICTLWTIKQGCLEAVNAPIFRAELWRGVQDYVDTIHGMLTSEGRERTLLASVEELKKKVSSLANSPAAWSEALPAMERDAIALERKIVDLAEVSEAAWWAHELALRIVHLQNLIYDFAPWLQPQFAKYCEDAGAQETLRGTKLTPASLPKLCSLLDHKFSALAEETRGSVEAQSAIQLLRSAITRTGSVSANLGKRLEQLAARADRLAAGMDFKFLYDSRKKLLATGFNVEENRLTPSHYDLLASEARAAAFVAIAKGDIPQESWFAMDRPFTRYKGEQVMLSWTGTMFEYLLPLLWMKSYPNTILDQTMHAAVRGQRKYAEEKGVACWGISEASCSKLSMDGHYHYEAFGVPGLAVSRDLSRDLVVSPYSTFLSLLVDPGSAMANIKKMNEMGMLGSYGFFESADFTASRLKEHSPFEIVQCWLAHHQGMSLMAVANVLCRASSQRRFHAEPLVAATERLLHEKAPRTSRAEVASAETAAAEAEAAAKAAAENWAVGTKANSTA